MCGIAGFLMRDGLRPDPEALARMAAALAHRGPDDRGLYQAGAAGLAQTRLSIIGLDSGHQPLLDADRRLALVANGEVYNYLELNAALRAEGIEPRTQSDSETILHRYATGGLEGLRALRGMYAFALHDAPAGRLLLGRDRLGIKPLFYIRLPDRIAFASEIKALLAILPAAPAIRPAALRQFLQHQFAAGEETVFAGIRRVPPGTVLSIGPALGIEVWRYWSALDAAADGDWPGGFERGGSPTDPRGALAGPALATLDKPARIGATQDPAAALETLDALLDAAMIEHMRADVPFGLFLSGGLDSAVLAALLHRHGAGRIRSFSVGYRGTALAHELDEAARVAAHFGFEHTPLELELDQVFGRLPHTIWCADELMRDYACLPTSLLAETASRSLKVVFSGEGGDEVFAGYGRYRPGFAERWIKGLLRPGSGGFRTRGQWAGRWARRLFGPELRAARSADRAPVIAAWRATPSGWSDLQRRQYVDLTAALPDNLLVKTDRMLMGFGLEGRVPFLDHRLVAFGLGLPDALKVRSGTGKWLLRRWAEPRLPPGHLDRPKRGFHVPVGDWLTGALAARLGERLIANPGIRAWFRTAAIPELVAARRAGRGGGRELFGLMQFAIWHRLFIERPGARPAPDEDPLEWV